MFEVGVEAAMELVEWFKVTEAIGLVTYAVQWSAVDGSQLISMEGVVRSCREGRKVSKLRESGMERGRFEREALSVGYLYST